MPKCSKCQGHIAKGKGHTCPKNVRKGGRKATSNNNGHDGAHLPAESRGLFDAYFQTDAGKYGTMGQKAAKPKKVAFKGYY